MEDSLALAADPRLIAIFNTHFVLIADLAFTWSGNEILHEPIRFYILNGGWSATKIALSLGLLTGELHGEGDGLVGDLSLTEDGRALVTRYHSELKEARS